MTYQRFRRHNPLAVFALWAACVGAPAMAKDSESAATKPAATQAAAATHEVKKVSLSSSLDATGTFYPIDPVEVRLRFDAYRGELTIQSAAAHGAQVRQGDVLLQIDPTDLERDLKAAQSELAVAGANLTKARADSKLSAQADALALKMSQNAAAQTEAGLKWWDEVNGPQILQSTEMRTKQARAYLEDQEDELDQLRKMYKSEDLTAATADIVIKRAVRAAEMWKINLGMTEAQARKTKESDYDQSRKAVEYANEEAKQGLAQLEIAQAHAKVVRQASLAAARYANQAAQKKVTELKSDLAKLTVKAPQDGVVFYGSLQGGAWQGNDPRTFRTSEKLPPSGGVVMTLYTPGKYKVVFDVPESKLMWLEPGMAVALKPVAFPQLACKGQLSAIPVAGKAAGAEQSFEMTVECDGMEDAAIRPGMKVAAHIEGKKIENIIAVPKEVIVAGKVKVRDADGNDQEKEVVTGRSDGKFVEILSGVEEGDKIVIGT